MKKLKEKLIMNKYDDYSYVKYILCEFQFYLKI